jgi:hypothetical protein
MVMLSQRTNPDFFLLLAEIFRPERLLERLSAADEAVRIAMSTDGVCVRAGLEYMKGLTSLVIMAPAPLFPTGCHL